LNFIELIEAVIDSSFIEKVLASFIYLVHKKIEN